MHGNRTWITREEIAEIHVQIANMALDKGEVDHAVDHLQQADTIRQIEKVGRYTSA